MELVLGPRHTGWNEFCSDTSCLYMTHRVYSHTYAVHAFFLSVPTSAGFEGFNGGFGSTERVFDNS